jgi:hypothetical protein
MKMLQLCKAEYQKTLATTYLRECHRQTLMSTVTPSLINFTSNTQWRNQNYHSRDHFQHTELYFNKAAHSRNDISLKDVLDERFFMRFWKPN